MILAWEEQTIPAACEGCGGYMFHAMFGPEDPIFESRELVALKCAVCEQEIVPREYALDS